MLLDMLRRKTPLPRVSLVTLVKGPFKGRTYQISDNGRLGRRFTLRTENGETSAHPYRRLRLAKQRMTATYRGIQRRLTTRRQRFRPANCLAASGLSPYEVRLRLNAQMEAKRQARQARRLERFLAPPDGMFTDTNAA